MRTGAPQQERDAARACAERAIALAGALDAETCAVLSRESALPASPLDAFDAAAAPRMLLWQGTSWMLAEGAALERIADGPGRFLRLAEASSAWRARCAVHGDTAPVLLTQVAFEERCAATGHWGANLPGARLVLPRRLLWRRHSGKGVVVDARTARADSSSATVAAELVDNPPPPLRSVEQRSWPTLDQRPFRDLVDEALGLLDHGGMRKLVVARAAEHRLGVPPDPRDILQRLHEEADERSTVYACDLDDGAIFLGSTPELLFHLAERLCRTMSLAGSRARGASPEEDARLGEELVASTKERKEHQLVVEHLVRRLRPRATSLSVPGHPTLRRLARVQHLETVIEAHLRDADPYDLLAALHPTPAVAGLPVDAALEWLRRHEGLHRGLYTGCLGWLRDGEAHAVVPLRGGIVRGRDVRLFAGAGIVETSDPDAELEETEVKLRPMRRALGL